MFPRELEFSRLLDSQNRDWIYEHKTFKLEKDKYTPDFYLPQEDLYIEVIGSRQAYHANKKKYLLFKKMFPEINFQILTFKGNLFKEGTQRIKGILKKHYQTSITLSEEEYKLVESLQKKGIKVIDIFRKGLEIIAKE